MRHLPVEVDCMCWGACGYDVVVAVEAATLAVAIVAEVHGADFTTVQVCTFILKLISYSQAGSKAEEAAGVGVILLVVAGAATEDVGAEAINLSGSCCARVCDCKRSFARAQSRTELVHSASSSARKASAR